MALQVQNVALDMIRCIQPLMEHIARRDKDLARQIRRSASSVALNIAEAKHSDPGNRRARFHTAAGSASEALVALKVASAWQYIAETQAVEALELLDRILAMLYRLKTR